MLRFTAMVSAAIFAAGVSFAESYICLMNVPDNSFVPKGVGLQLDEQKKSGLVYGPMIHSVHGKPIPARVRRTNAGEWEFAWRLTIPANPSDARVRYRAVLNKEKLSVYIRGEIRHATNFVGGSGRCQQKEFLEK